jgi:hypothetical protein
MSHEVVDLDDSNAVDWEAVNKISPHGSLFHAEVEAVSRGIIREICEDALFLDLSRRVP